MHTEDEESIKPLVGDTHESAASRSDIISVGNIDDSQAIAVGKEIQQNVYEGFTAEQVSRLLSDMHETYTASALSVEIPDPPEQPKPPTIPNFIGRSKELAAYGTGLSEDGYVIVAGMAGVGKTAVAAQLASQEGSNENTFWHTFHEDEGVETIIWKLAAFLAQRGHSDLWNMLQSAALTQSQPPPPDILFDYLFQLICAQGYLLCFDDFHLVDDDPLIDKLVDRLQPAIQAKEIQIIVTSRRVPDFITWVDFEPLAGLTLDDTRLLLKSQGHTIVEGLLKELHDRTEGNAELLTLTLNALQNTKHPARLLDNLVEAANIERFLLNQVDNELEEDHRHVMNGVSALLGYPGTRDAIEEVLGGVSARRELAYLTNRYLLQMFERDEENVYAQHAIVQAFYYDLLSRKQRREMHARAGEYYFSEEDDRLRAALHFERADEYERAAQLVTQDIWQIINSGRVRPLQNLIERFKVTQVNSSLWLQVQLANGQVCSFVGEDEQARQILDEVLTRVEGSVGIDGNVAIGIEAAIVAGDLLQYRNPTDAMTYLERGATLLEQISSPDEEALNHYRAALHIKLGSVYLGLSDIKQSEVESEAGLQLLADAPSQLRISALINIGLIHYYQGSIPQALEHTEQALQDSISLNDHYQVLKTQGNICFLRFVSGDWERSLNDGLAALALAKQLGNNISQTRLSNNIGVMYTRLGNYEAAETFLDSARDLAVKFNIAEYKIESLLSLADLQTRQKKAEDALLVLADAEHAIEELESDSYLSALYRIRAEADLQLANCEQALVAAKESVAMAAQLGLEIEEGMNQRVLGLAYIANGSVAEGTAAFAHSLTLLDSVDPYESARTRLAWGQSLDNIEQSEQSIKLFSDAHAVFKGLNAHAEQAETERLLISK